ncbi:hypothetical protein J4H70_17590 [Vibrio alginolyticus]|uniref:hypothetical protein n=1 Tax=Vibrio alginolyticus TaxID=663 RepID=UPI001BD1CD3B|nr:hypothetical protein [Vibrio alginolyticus]MBS9810588.1 hypothetical protein [Vibrio alginolyticus]MCR9484075.1 hypothetical protein [Vibrio alginolyticus]
MMMIENFKGAELSETECDKIALDRVSASLLKKEANLATTAWFDYRLLHPTTRTYLFAHFYEEAYRYMLRLHVDYEQAEGDSPRSFLPKKDPLGKPQHVLNREKKTGVIAAYRNCTMVWKARQKADEYGIPYDVFCMSGMKAAIGRIWQRTPNPAQLYSQEILNAIIDRWADLATQKMFVATNPFYSLKNWSGHPSQFDHASWVCEQINARVNPEFALAQYGFKTPVIPSQMMRSKFRDSVILSAQRLSKHLV